MSSTLQQQVFALDAKYNTYRTSNSPNFRTLYIRRRSQLLREYERDSEKWKDYLKLRTTLLQQHYGYVGNSGGGETGNVSLSRIASKGGTSPVEVRTGLTKCTGYHGIPVPTGQAKASHAMVGGNTVAENYAFIGVHHIFDQHSEAVTMVKFANNDRTKLCCSSLDGSLSLCDVSSQPPSVMAKLKGHDKAVTCFDWSVNNDLIVSSSLDGTIKVWNVTDMTCLRTVQCCFNSQLLCCIFQPSNNNLIITGNNRGDLRIANVSTGRFIKNACRIGGSVLCLTSDANGKILWTGNDKGEIVSVTCNISGGLNILKRLTVHPPCSITNISYRAWISREARDPMLLVNCTNNSLCLFSVVDCKGKLQFRRKYYVKHLKCSVRSIFCPIMSFRQGACIVTGSEDGSVYFLDIGKTGSKAVVNTLQGHASAVLGVSFNYDESLLATSDKEGLVILWKRGNLP